MSYSHATNLTRIIGVSAATIRQVPVSSTDGGKEKGEGGIQTSVYNSLFVFIFILITCCLHCFHSSFGNLNSMTCIDFKLLFLRGSVVASFAVQRAHIMSCLGT